MSPPKLLALEEGLWERADLVFPGGYSLYEAKRSRHPNIHPFPSSVDVAHFAKARAAIADPADQVEWPKPRLGFYGVIDERMDIDLVARLADRSDEHTSELQSLMRNSYAVFCLKKKNKQQKNDQTQTYRPQEAPNTTP